MISAIREIHPPTDSQSFVYTLTSKTVDLTTVSAVVFKLRDPKGNVRDLAAVLVGTATPTLATFSHRCDPTSGEAQTPGLYQMWVSGSSPSGGVKSKQPKLLRVRPDHETLTNNT